ncbi:Uncharacterised protein [uncultured Comamonas sp.]|nr:Uncharacterised protein [uncultured Comamonas sp.]
MNGMRPKRRANLEKHGIDFVDADLVMESEFVWIRESSRKDEPRHQALAYVFDVLMVLSVAFVQRGKRNRIISLRPAHASERSAYYDWLENNFPDQ